MKLTTHNAIELMTKRTVTNYCFRIYIVYQHGDRWQKSPLTKFTRYWFCLHTGIYILDLYSPVLLSYSFMPQEMTLYSWHFNFTSWETQGADN